MDLAMVAVFCSVLFEPIEPWQLFSLAGEYDGVCSSDCGEAAVGAGADSAEMRERTVQQNGSQRMSDASSQSLLSQHGHTMDESLGRPIAR